jgi:hypothetical protein
MADFERERCYETKGEGSQIPPPREARHGKDSVAVGSNVPYLTFIVAGMGGYREG